MRRILTVLYLPICLILSLPYMLIVYVVGRFSRPLQRKLGYLFTRPYGMGILWITGARMEITGQENLEPSDSFLFVANHRSLLDSPVLMALSKKPLSYVSKMEMKKIPIFKHWMVLLHCLFLDRNNNREGLKVILKGIEQLKGGDRIAIFPQGTRSVGDVFLPFKAGSFKLATKSNRPILPVAIYGTANVFENNGFNVKKAKVRVHVFPAIETKDMTPEDLKALPAQVETMIHDKVNAFIALEAAGQ